MGLVGKLGWLTSLMMRPGMVFLPRGMSTRVPGWSS